MPASETEPQAVRQTLVWAKVMVVGGVVIAASLAFFYALPYQAAVQSSVTGMAGVLK